MARIQTMLKAMLLVFVIALLSAIVILMYITPYADFILALLLVVAVIAIISYHFSPGLIMFANKARRFDDAFLSAQLDEMHRKFNIPLPVVAMVDSELPDMYITGVSKRKMVLVVTANLLDKDRTMISKTIEREFFNVKNKRILDMAIENLIFNPIKKLVDQITYKLFFQGVQVDKQVKNGFLIRPATAHDFIDINSMVELYINDGVKGLAGQISIHNISDLFKRKASTILIVESGKKVAGFLIGYVKPEVPDISGKINLLAIDKEFRRAGMGNTLMASYLDIVRSAGCHRCYLEVRRGNTNAISLYKKIGFIENGILKDFYGMDVDAISMYKEIKQK